VNDDEMTPEQKALLKRALSAFKHWWSQPDQEGPDPALDDLIETISEIKKLDP